MKKNLLMLGICFTNARMAIAIVNEINGKGSPKPQAMNGKKMKTNDHPKAWHLLMKSTLIARRAKMAQIPAPTASS